MAAPRSSAPGWRTLAVLGALLQGGSSWGAQTNWERAVENFERDPLSLNAAQALLSAYVSENRVAPAPSDRLPAVYYRAARMARALAPSGAVLDERSASRLDWSWKYAGEAELPVAIEDWLWRRLAEGADAECAVAAGLALFRERGAHWAFDEEELRELFRVRPKEALSPDAHLRSAELLEKGGFLENARREYARAAGLLAYGRKGPAAASQALSKEERARAVGGWVRMLGALGRWPEAEEALPKLEEGKARADLGSQIRARRVSPLAAPAPAWKRLAWEWVPSHYRLNWELRRMLLLPEGLASLSEWDVTLLDPQTGGPLWTWDPGQGDLKALNVSGGRLWLRQIPGQARPAQVEGQVLPSAMGPGVLKPFKLAQLELKTGQAESHNYLQAQKVEPLPGGAVLVRRNASWEIRLPWDQMKIPLVLETTPREKLRLAGAGPDVVLLETHTAVPGKNPGDLSLSAFDRQTGRELWHTLELLEESLPRSAAQIYAQGVCEPFPCGQLGPARVYQGLAATLVCRDLKTGKRLWSYVDAVLSVRAQDSRAWVSAAGPFEVQDKSILCAVYPEVGVAALDARDGRLLWRQPLCARPLNAYSAVTAPALATSPVTGGRPAFWVANGGFLLALDPLTGETVWSTPLHRPETRLRGPSRALQAPLIQADRAWLLEAHGRTGRVESVRLEVRPANVLEREGELWSREVLLKELELSPKADAAHEAIAMGLSRVQEVHKRLQAWVLRNAPRIETWVLAHAGPYQDDVFTKVIQPILKAAPDPQGLEEAVALLLMGAPESQKAELEALRALARQRQAVGLFVREEESRAAAAKLRDAESAVPKPLPLPAEDEF